MPVLCYTVAVNNPTWIRVQSIDLSESALHFAFDDFAGRTFSVRLEYDQPIAQKLGAFPAPGIQRLLNYLAVTQAFYFFNFEYYDEVRAYYQLTAAEQAFFENLALHGLAEFRYTNHIDMHAQTRFSGEHRLPQAQPGIVMPQLHGAIVTNGGGKDGAVASQAAHAALDSLAWFTLNKDGLRAQIIESSPFHEQISTGRFIHPVTSGQKYWGHKPLNAELGLFAAVAALVTGKQYVVVGNEHSANEPNIVHDEFEVNHQYTKSYVFEQQLAALIDGLGLGLNYFSIVRPLYELQILRIFADFPAYHHVFVSCNHGVREGRWCLACAKCAFVVLGLTAINPALVAGIWGDSLLMAKPALQKHIIELVSAAHDKPFECVGTLEECQLALGLIARNPQIWEALPSGFRNELARHLPANLDALQTAIMGEFDRPNNIPSELKPAVYRFFAEHLS
jgi:UDP-N-acetyl-alpha-D-muramoyl-L-alanyl-L-glutamate epimerase